MNQSDRSRAVLAGNSSVGLPLVGKPWIDWQSVRRRAPILRTDNRGFALIITLTLLALLVLAVLALSALAKISSQAATMAVYQTQARQNALLGLQVGLRDLQRHAGADERITGMAGLTGIPAQAANVTRHWCGVWDQATGALDAWLASGAQTGGGAILQSGLDAVELVGDNTVGAAAVNSEHVIAGKVPLTQMDALGAPGTASVVGAYAYLVLDEGVKVSAYASPGQLSMTGIKPLLTSTAPNSAAAKLAAAINAYVNRLPAILSYEQLCLLPHPAATLTPSVRQDNFHHVTLTSQTVTGGQLWSGNININTSSTIVWRSLLETYNSIPGVVAIPSASLISKGNAIGNGLAASNLGKVPNGPFMQVDDLTTYLLVHFPPSGSPTAGQIIDAIKPLLSVRSDTFRIRSYGEATNPADAAKIEAVAYCEAVVQRTPEVAPGGLGRKYIIVTRRWLGPGDL